MSYSDELLSDEKLSRVLLHIKRNKSQRCLFCSSGSFTATSMQVHLKSPEHRIELIRFRILLKKSSPFQDVRLARMERFFGRPNDDKRVKAIMSPIGKRRLMDFICFDRRVAALKSRAWVGEMHILAYEYLSSGDIFQPKYFAIARALDEYEHVEKVTILTLVIWKSECLMVIPNKWTNYLDVLAWASNGWKCRKEEVFNSSSTRCLVLTLIKPFLEV